MINRGLGARNLFCPFHPSWIAFRLHHRQLSVVESFICYKLKGHCMTKAKLKQVLSAVSGCEIQVLPQGLPSLLSPWESDGSFGRKAVLSLITSRVLKDGAQEWECVPHQKNLRFYTKCSIIASELSTISETPALLALDLWVVVITTGAFCQ